MLMQVVRIVTSGQVNVVVNAMIERDHFGMDILFPKFRWRGK
jgi:hypothetical protein